MSRFLLRHLSNPKLADQVLIPNWKEGIPYTYYSIHQQYVSDFPLMWKIIFFYSIPRPNLFAAVIDCMEANGISFFQNECGIQIESFK